MELKPWETTGMVVLQAESEISSINMVYGGASTGKTGDDLVVEPRHQPDVRGVSYLAGAELPCLIVNLPARRPGPGYDPAFAGRLFPGLQRRRPRRFPHDRAGSQLGAGDARPCGRGVRPRVQIPQSGADPRRRRHRSDDGEGGARTPASAQDRRGAEAECRSWAAQGKPADRAQYRDLARIAVREDGSYQQTVAGEIQGAGRERGALRRRSSATMPTT